MTPLFVSDRLPTEVVKAAILGWLGDFWDKQEVYHAMGVTAVSIYPAIGGFSIEPAFEQLKPDPVVPLKPSKDQE